MIEARLTATTDLCFPLRGCRKDIFSEHEWLFAINAFVAFSFAFRNQLIEQCFDFHYGSLAQTLAPVHEKAYKNSMDKLEPKKPKKQRTFMLSAECIDQIEQIAARKRRTLSDVVEHAVNEFARAEAAGL